MNNEKAIEILEKIAKEAGSSYTHVDDEWQMSELRDVINYLKEKSG